MDGPRPDVDRRPRERLPDPGTAGWCDASAALGGLVWLALVATGRAGAVERWLLLAVLVLVPLALPLVAEPNSDGALPPRYRLAAALQPPAALTAAASGLAEGLLAGALALPWALVAALLAAHGLGRLARRGRRPAEEAALDAGLAYLVVGAAGLLADRLAVSGGFAPVVVHLSAVHFHYAGFLVPLHAAMAGRLAPGRRRAVRAVAALVVGSPVVVATGFAALAAFQFVGAVAVAAGALGAAALALSGVARAPPGPRRRAAGALLGVAALALVVSMPLAVAYGYGATVPRTVVAVPEMLRWHGRANAVGFGLAGVLGWRLLAPPARVAAPDPPLSRLRAGRRVGADFFERAGAAGGRDDPPGQLDDLGAHAGPGFDPDGVHPEVRRFYERTGEYALAFDLTWHRGFRTAVALAGRVTARVGQLNLPGPGAAGPWQVAGRVVALDPDADGRTSPRAWVRTYVDGKRASDGDDRSDGDAVFVSAYAAHDRGRERFLTVGLPLPAGCTLSAVLRFESSDGDGLALTSAARHPGDDAGLYLATPAGTVRLPMHERFRVRPAREGVASDAPLDAVGAADGGGRGTDCDDGGKGDDGGERRDDDRGRGDDGGERRDDGAPPLVARHEMWLLGRRLLTVEYAIRRADDGESGDRSGR